MRGATISDKRDYLRADLIHRQASAELEKFLHHLKEAAFSHPSSRVLIVAHIARATYKIDKFHGSQFLDLLAARPSMRVAPVAPPREVQPWQPSAETAPRLR